MCYFTCTDCKKTQCRLEVHHLTPFKDILNIFLDGRVLSELTDEEFEKLSYEIEQYHKDRKVDGITYCIECHKKHDARRR